MGSFANYPLVHNHKNWDYRCQPTWTTTWVSCPFPFNMSFLWVTKMTHWIIYSVFHAITIDRFVTETTFFFKKTSSNVGCQSYLNEFITFINFAFRICWLTHKWQIQLAISSLLPFSTGPAASYPMSLAMVKLLEACGDWSRCILPVVFTWIFLDYGRPDRPPDDLQSAEPGKDPQCQGNGKADIMCLKGHYYVTGSTLAQDTWHHT